MTLTLKRFYYKRALLFLGVLFFVFSGLHAQQDYDYVEQSDSTLEGPVVFEKNRFVFNVGLQVFYPSVDFENRPEWFNYEKIIVIPAVISADLIFHDFFSAGLFLSQRGTSVSFDDTAQVHNEFLYYEVELGARLNFHFLGLFMNKFASDFIRRRYDAYLSVGLAGYMVLESGTKNNEVVRADLDLGIRPVGVLGFRYAVNEYLGFYAEGIYGKMGHLGFGLTIGIGRN